MLLSLRVRLLYERINKRKAGYYKLLSDTFCGNNDETTLFVRWYFATARFVLKYTASIRSKYGIYPLIITMNLRDLYTFSNKKTYI